MRVARPHLYLSLLIVAAALAVLAAYWFAAQAQRGEISSLVADHRYAWYAMPMVALAFIALSLVPVMLLVSLTGIAFGPVLGPLYAMAGCLASASTAFALGRLLGHERVHGWGGERVARLTRVVRRNGTLAVFLVRKVPAPFVLVNVLLGASAVAYRDFVIGTALGMAAMVIALAGFGYHLVETWRDPSPEGVLRGLLFLCIPLSLAWMINRGLRASGDHDCRA